MKGILLGNLGTPLKPTTREVRKYLREFLMDPFVIDIPFLLRWLLVNLIIVPFRAAKSARAYQSVWREEGSPLLYYCERQKEALSKRLKHPVVLGMNYGKPDIQTAVRELTKCGVDEILCLLLYPHYALSSYEALAQKIRRAALKYPQVKFHFTPPFYDHPSYIEALSASIKGKLPDQYDHILFSYHGVPERHILKADTAGFCKLDETCCEKPSASHEKCYRAQVIQTARMMAKHLKIPEEKYSISFQSRLGREPWLRPFTDLVTPELARQKNRRLVVICPSFTSDCLETLEEIGIRAREDFIQNGGEELVLIPCLNEHPKWIKAMEMLAES